MAQHKKRRNPESRNPRSGNQGSQSQRPQNIKKYRKPLNLNIGMLIFGAVFVYIIMYVVMYFQTNHIRHYEVQMGSLATNNIFRGIALRNETIVNAETAGYVNYYAREGQRVATGDLVYTVDETGRLKEYMESASLGENSLSTRELAEFRNEIVNFMHSFDPVNFEGAYDFKYSLKGMVLKLANTNMIENINNINGDMDLSEMVDLCRSTDTGVVAYWTDGYENLTADMVSAEILEETSYERKQLVGVELVAQGDAVYKLSHDEEWSIVIPVDTETGIRLEEEQYVKVRFLKNQYESWGATKLLHNGDGNSYIEITFTNSMITFSSERFMDIELILDDDAGLKIPNSSIVEKEFFLIPDGFITQGGDNGRDGVIRQSYLEDGTISSEFVETGIYNFDEQTGEYYLDTTALEIGDILIKPESQETYTVSKRAALLGVYNMNKGYADFSQINILSQNEEYAIVESNTRYGLNVYDNIVLNADSVTDDQFIF